MAHATQMMQDLRNTSLLMAAEATGPASWRTDWSAPIDMAEGETATEDGQLIPTSDGNSVGVYTTGGGADIYEGRIVKLNPTGTELWSTRIQIDTQTTAKKVAEAPDGTLYVVGTTFYEGKNYAYVSGFDSATGTLKGSVRLDNGDDRVVIGGAKALTQGVAVFYTVREEATYSGAYFYKLVGYDDYAVKNAATYAPGGTYLSIPNDVIANDNALVAVFSSGAYVSGKLVIFKIESDDAPVVDEGNYQCGDANSEGFAFAMLGSSNYSVKRCTINDKGAITTLWSATLSDDFTTNYYTPVVKIAGDDNVYFWHKSNYDHRVAKVLGTDGTVAWCQTLNSFDNYEISGGFAYTLGTTGDGNFVAGGHSGDLKVFWYELNGADGNKIGEYSTLVDDGYTQAYSYENMSSFKDDTFYFAGWLRYDGTTTGNYPFFTALNVDNTEAPVFAILPGRGHVPSDYPGSGLILDDGSAIVALTVSNHPAVGKYDSTGALEWYKALEVGGEGRFVHLNDDGSISLAGTYAISNWESRPLVAKFSAEGDVESWQYLNQTSYPTLLDARWLEDGTVQLLSQGSDSSWNNGVILETINPAGETTMRLTEGYLTAYKGQICEDGSLLVWGWKTNSDYINQPVVIRVAADGTLAFNTMIGGSYTSGSYAYGAWTDAEGYTYVGGAYNEYYPFLAVLSPTGEVVALENGIELGFYESIVEGPEGLPVAIGTITPSGTTRIEGRVRAIKSGSLDTQWEVALADSEAAVYTYALQGVNTVDGLAVSGYNANGAQVAPLLATISPEGDLVGTTIGSELSNVYSDYYIAATVASAPADEESDYRVMTLSANSLANLVYLGYINMYKWVAPSSGNPGIFEDSTLAPIVLSVSWYDLQGRRVDNPGTGVYIQREILSGGSIRTTKIIR